MWWVSDGRNFPCCQTADPDVLATDCSQFDCDTCLVRQELDELDAENAEAWSLFRQLCTRFLVDTGSASIALSRLTADLSPSEFSDVTTRLGILYEAYYPRKAQPDHG